MLFRVTQISVVAGCAMLGAASVGVAADIPYPVKSPPPPPVVVPDSWAGFYIGGQVGYGMDDVRWRNLGASTLFSPLDSVTHDRGGGVIGGGQVGYNIQLNRLVFGVEGSFSGAGLDRSFASPYFPATDTWSSKLTWLGTVTGRVGYSFENWLPYIKGGFAAGNVDTTLQNTAVGVISQSSAVHYGWTLGAGVDFKVTRNVTLGLEFMHTDLGRRTDINGVPAGAAAAETYGVGVRNDSIMARFNYLFGGR